MNLLVEWWESFLQRDFRFQLVFGFSVILLIVSVTLFSIVIRLRSRKARAERKAKELIESIEPILLQIIYQEEEIDWKHEAIQLRNLLNTSMYEFHSYARVSDYLIELHKQLEGDSAKRIERIYRELELPKMTLELLKDGRWHQKVKAIGALSEFKVKQYLFEVIQYMDHPRRLVRDEAQFAAIVLGGKRATGTISELNYEISKWQQLRLIEECATIGDSIKEDVLSWLSAKNESLIELSLRMCIRMGWYEAVILIPQFISHKREEIRLLSVEAIGELGSAEMIDELFHRFEVETSRVQAATLEAIAHLDIEGISKDFLRGQMKFGDLEIALKATQAYVEACGEEDARALAAELDTERARMIDQVLYGAV